MTGAAHRYPVGAFSWTLHLLGMSSTPTATRPASRVSEVWPGQRPKTGSRCTPTLQCLDAICAFGSPRSLATVSIFRFRFDASVISSSKIRPDISMPGNRLRANSAAWEMAPALTKSTKPRSMRSPKGTVIRSKSLRRNPVRRSRRRCIATWTFQLPNRNGVEHQRSFYLV